MSIFENTLQDVRFGMRALRKNPGVTAIAALSLALGIGANTAIFSLIDAVLVKLLPVRDPQSLVLLTDPMAQGWALAQYLNQVVNDSGSFAVGINLNFSDAGITFAQYVANTVAHEVSHTFGLNEGYYDASRHAGTNNGSVGGTAKVNNSGNAFPYDIMSNGQAADPYLQFKFPTTDILKAATGLESNFSTPLDDALKMWRDNFNLDGVANIDGIRITGPDDILPEIQVLNGGLPYLGDGSETLDFGTVGKDGVGGAFNDTTLTLFNYGAATLTLTDAKLAGAASDFSIITAGIAGQTIAPQSSFSLDVRFDPLAIGNLGNTLIIDSDAASAPVFELKLDGQSISATHATAD